jgi:hypothetical protein
MFIFKFAKNVPIAPVHHYFESKKDWRYYFLYFPTIQMQDCSINIIEEENGTSNAFNYYAIELEMEKGIEILE